MHCSGLERSGGNGGEMGKKGNFSELLMENGEVLLPNRCQSCSNRRRVPSNRRCPTVARLSVTDAVGCNALPDWQRYINSVRANGNQMKPETKPPFHETAVFQGPRGRVGGPPRLRLGMSSHSPLPSSHCCSEGRIGAVSGPAPCEALDKGRGGRGGVVKRLTKVR